MNLHIPIEAHYTLQGIAFTLGVIGMLFIGNKKRIAFLLFPIGNVVGIVLSLTVRPVMFSALLMSLVLIILNLRNYVKWGKNGSSRNVQQL